MGITATIDLPLDPDRASELLADELELRGLSLERGPDGRLLFAADDADWAPGRRAVAEITFARADGGSRVTLELRGWEGLLEAGYGADEREPLGWFADRLVAPLLEAVSPEAVAGWLTDRVARRPTGERARDVYREPEMHLPGIRNVLKALALGPGDHLLEIGCGGGALLREAHATGCRGTGVDHSPEMLRLAGEQNSEALAEGRLRLVQADAENLPFADGEFTAIAMSYVFFFFPDPAAVLRECRRVLVEAGRLAFVTSPPELRGTPACPEPIVSQTRLYEDEELAQLTREAGFAQVWAGRTASGSQLVVASRL